MSLQAAQAAFSRRDFAAAQQAAESVLRERPSDPGANQLLGLIALERNDALAALAYLRRSDKAAPGQPHTLNALGVALRMNGEMAEARRAFTRAGERGSADAWRNLGSLEASSDPKASARAYEQALKLNANDAAAHAGLAQALELTHELPNARSHAEKALALDANNEIAALTLAQVAVRERQFEEGEAHAGRVAQQGKSPTNRALAWGVIGDARDKSDDAANAFAAFTEGNRILLQLHGALLRAAHLPYHPDGVDRTTAFVEQTDTSTWSKPEGATDPTPVFLVGFPRSGTTLLEQVLSAHSRLVCIEEREHLAQSAQAVAADPNKLPALSGDEIQAIRGEYWKRVNTETRVDGRIVVDKLPLNIIFLPLIRRVFPEAKVILALRDPRDVVLSCYQQRFGMNAAMVQFLDLRTAASYYDRVMRLGLLCRERLGLDVHDVRYEDVVADLESIARSVTAFLDLEFEPLMLAFREAAAKRNINTPSGRQVVEPMHNRSVARWKRYETQLAPVLPMLNAWAERFGYS
jgi:Tfp pilus assembly protein PilF